MVYSDQVFTIIPGLENLSLMWIINSFENFFIQNALEEKRIIFLNEFWHMKSGSCLIAPLSCESWPNSCRWGIPLIFFPGLLALASSSLSTKKTGFKGTVLIFYMCSSSTQYLRERMWNLSKWVSGKKFFKNFKKDFKEGLTRFTTVPLKLFF